MEQVKVEQVLVEWTAPLRPYKKRDREYYTTIASITFLLGVILLLMKEFLLIGVVFAFAFLSYILASVPPRNIRHQLTAKGIRTDGQLFKWDELVSFWIDKKWSFEVVYIQTKRLVPGFIILILDPRQREKILKILKQHLVVDKPEPSFVDKASKWLQEKVPLES